MKQTLALALLLAASCSSSSGPPSLFQTWIYTDSAAASGSGLTFKTDHTYVSSVLQLTSETSGNVQIQTGTFTATSSTITFTPTQWSCAEATAAPYSAPFEFNGSTLDIAFTTGAIAYTVDTSAASAFALTDGCFDQSGAFTASPLVAIGSCAAPGGACSGTEECCFGAVCTGDNGGTCAAECAQGSDCDSGCCASIGTVNCTGSGSYIDTCGFCAAAAECSAGDAG